MTTVESQRAVRIRGRMLGYIQPQPEPVFITNILSTVQEALPDVSESDIRDVLLRLIGSGKLMYTPDMRISLGK
ncbi:MAG: hypothetical protein ACREBQ_14270 [Nitrososphaerales archaeon]